MPRPIRLLPFLLVLAMVASACGTSAADGDGGTDGDGPSATLPASLPEMPDETTAPTEDELQPGTELNACEIVTAADVAAAVGIEELEVGDGEFTESPTSLSPGRTECEYTGDWGGVIVSLTPEDGANLFDAARSSYDDASDREVAGADGAFWSESQNRGFFWNGAVTVMLQVGSFANGADRDEVVTAIGQAALDKVS